MRKKRKRSALRVPRVRNPFALAARRRRPGVESSPRSYRRQAKHKRPILED
jgi:hypothetical protein